MDSDCAGGLDWGSERIPSWRGGWRWYRLPWELVELPFLEMFKRCAEVTLGEVAQ